MKSIDVVTRADPIPRRSSPKRRELLRVIVVLSTGTSACFASKSDVAQLQSDVRGVRIGLAQVDSSVRSGQLRLANRIDQLADSLRLFADSIDKTLRLTLRANADAVGAGHATDQRTVTLEELLRVTLQQLSDLKSDMAILRESLARNASGSLTDSTTNHVAAQPTEAVVLRSALDQLRAGAYHSARVGFTDYVARWPGSESAPGALLHLADAFAGDVGLQSADSVYQLVEQRYPKSDEAATALYKHGRYLCTLHDFSRGQETLSREIRLYPNATATDLAREFVKHCR